jgi:predicted dehydrogenase
VRIRVVRSLVVSNQVRVGLVGYGMAGRDFHAPLLRAADDLLVTHVVTGNPERATQARDDLPGVQIVASVDELVADPDSLDLVVVASPGNVHVAHAQAAIERGIAVVVDKPLANDAESGRALVELARDRAVPLTVFQNRRWYADHLTARAVLASGVLGEVVRFESRYERWRPVPKSRWRENLSTDEGGGLLMDLQPHLVDGALDLFGPVEAVYAELRSVTTVGDDVAFLVLHHRSGVRSHLGATSLAAAPGPRIRLMGRSATYLVADTEGEPTAYTSWLDPDDDHRGWLVRGEEAEPVQSAPGDIADFYPAVVAMVRDGAPPPVDPADAVAVLEVLDAAKVSARDNVVVRIS